MPGDSAQKKIAKGASRRLFISFLLLLCLGCSLKEAPPEREALPASARLLRDVPFHPQEKFQCGPSALASVLNYWRADESPSRIASAIFSRQAGGVLGIDLENYAREKGFEAIQYRGSIEDLILRIERGQPLIILIDGGTWVWSRHHFMTVVGYDGSAVFVHSGREKFKRIPNEELIPEWKKTDFWTLLILPPLKKESVRQIPFPDLRTQYCCSRNLHCAI